MPGSLPAVADALAYRPPPSISYSNLSIAPTSVPSSSSLLSSPSSVAVAAVPKIAQPAPQTVSAVSSTSVPADQGWFLADPALTGQAFFSPAPTDSGNGGGSAPSALQPSSGASAQSGPMEHAASLPVAAASAQTSPTPAADFASQDFVAQPPSAAPVAPAVVAPAVLALPPSGSSAPASVPAVAPPAAPSGSTSPSSPTTAATTPAAQPNNLLPIIAVGADAGAAPLVKVFDAVTGKENFEFLAYDQSFRGGVRVASADLNGDGVRDIITAPGPGMAPEIKVFDGKTGVQFAGPVGDFLAYDRSMQGGVFVAAGDVTGDPFNDIIVGPGAGGGAEVRAFSGKDGSLLHSFNAYGRGYEAGLPVAVGYWAGASRAYVVTGTGPGAPAEARVFDAVTGQQVPGPVGDLHPYGPDFRGGVWVATGDTNGDGTSDVITGAGVGHTPEVKVYDGQTGSVLQDFLAGDSSDQTGVRVAATYVAGATHEDIVTADGPGAAPQVNVYSGATGQLLAPPQGGFLAFDPSQRNGLFTAAAIAPTASIWITPATETLSPNETANFTVHWSTDLPNATGDPTYISWGDNSAFTQYSPNPIPGQFTAPHAYATVNTYTINTQIVFLAPGGTMAGGSASATVTVAVPPPTPPPPSFAPPPTCSCTCTCGSPFKVNSAPVGLVPPSASPWPIRYADGVVEIASSDLSSDGFGEAWGQGRSWSNNPGYAAGGANGNGWVDTRTPHLIRADGTDDNTIVAVGDGNTALYFDLVNGAYQARYYDQSKLVHNTASQEFVLTDDSGDQFHFADFSVTSTAEQGAFKSYVDPAGNTTTVTSWSSNGRPAEVQRSTVSNGATITESLLYVYVSPGTNGGLLQNVTLRRQTNGGAWSTVRQVQYTYYDGTTSYGNLGDLQLAQVLDGSNNVLDTSYYRYYTSADAGSIGYVGGLKYVFSAESYARLVTALGATAPTAATDAQVSAYADNYFEYDSQHRATKEIAQGAGDSTASGGLGTFTYAYTASANAAGFNS